MFPLAAGSLFLPLKKEECALISLHYYSSLGHHLHFQDLIVYAHGSGKSCHMGDQSHIFLMRSLAKEGHVA